MIFGYGIPITLIARTKAAPDALGNDTWTTVESTVTGVFDPGGSNEQVQGQDLLTQQPTVYLPSGTVIGAVDAVRVNGDVYEVDGSPNAPQSPFTAWQPGIVVRLKRVTG